MEDVFLIALMVLAVIATSLLMAFLKMEVLFPAIIQYDKVEKDQRLRRGLAYVDSVVLLTAQKEGLDPEYEKKFFEIYDKHRAYLKKIIPININAEEELIMELITDWKNNFEQELRTKNITQPEGENQ